MAQGNFLCEYPYEVSHRDIKYPRVELKTGRLLFVLPFGHSSDILYEKHKNWIFKKFSFMEECMDCINDRELDDRSDEEFKKLVQRIIKETYEDFKEKINVVYYRKMKTKWASLSSSGNLTFNKLMKYLPGYLIEYIIFHELVHFIEKKHNKKFWSIIKERYRDYKKMEKELFGYWFRISENNGTLEL